MAAQSVVLPRKAWQAILKHMHAERKAYKAVGTYPPATFTAAWRALFVAQTVPSKEVLRGQA